MMSLLVLYGCIAPIVELPAEPVAPALPVGGDAAVVLHTYRLDVEDYRLSLDLEELRGLPPEALDAVRVLDLPLGLVVGEVVDRIATMDAEARLAAGPAATNVSELLVLTPDTTNLEGTGLAPLEGLASQVGIPLARPLADLFQVGVTEALLGREVLTEAVVAGLVDSHPAVVDGHVSVSLGDLLGGFEDLAVRLGPAQTEAGVHPGIVTRMEDVRAIRDDFRVSFAANANALPYAGIDLTNASVASVNSVPSQMSSLFDFEDEGWLQIEGLVSYPRVGALSMSLAESSGAFSPSARPDDPVGSAVWQAPPWELERIVMDAAVRTVDGLDKTSSTYRFGTGADLFSMELSDAGWLEISTFGDVGPPPAPAYLWDVVLEIAEARLRDGGVAQGTPARFDFQDVSLGLTADDLATSVRRTLEADPEALRPLTQVITENGTGAPDVYYRPVDGLHGPEDWLLFVHPDDIPVELGGPVRPYDYSVVGFFSDPELTERVSARARVGGDDRHEKIRVMPGDVVYAMDDEEAVFELTIAGKPSPSRLAIDVRRVR